MLNRCCYLEQEIFLTFSALVYPAVDCHNRNLALDRDILLGI